MFNCAFCLNPIGPRVKPVMQADSTVRQMSYVNEVEVIEEDERKFTSRKPKTVTKVSNGFEFTREHTLCPSCAGVKPTTYVAPNEAGVIAIVKGIQAYARKSNKKLEDDRVMHNGIEQMKTVPLQILSKALEDTKITDRKVPGRLAYTLMENVISRANENDPKRITVDEVGNVIARRPSKRAGLDFIEGFSLMKTFEQMGGKL